jgi:hypothetical protein
MIDTIVLKMWIAEFTKKRNPAARLLIERLNVYQSYGDAAFPYSMGVVWS